MKSWMRWDIWVAIILLVVGVHLIADRDGVAVWIGGGMLGLFVGLVKT